MGLMGYYKRALKGELTRDEVSQNSFLLNLHRAMRPVYPKRMYNKMSKDMLASEIQHQKTYKGALDRLRALRSTTTQERVLMRRKKGLSRFDFMYAGMSSGVPAFFVWNVTDSLTAAISLWVAGVLYVLKYVSGRVPKSHI